MKPIRPIRCAYLDPVYPGHGADYSKPGTPEFHPDAMRWDDPNEHVALMEQAERDFPDGWALSTNEAGVRAFFHRAPARARLAPWVTTSTGAIKMFRVAFCWEAVIYSTPFVTRSQAPGRPAQLNWIAAGKGHNHNPELASAPFLGAKPRRFCFWLFRLLGLGGHPDDVLVDMFPGSGAVTRAWDEYRALAVTKAGVTQGSLFAEAPPRPKRKRKAKVIGG